MTNAVCAPRPVQPKLRLWIGGQGEKRMLRIVARHADGWNVPFLAPDIYEQRERRALRSWCDKERRDPRAIIRTATRARDRRRRGAGVAAAGGKAPASCSAGLTDWVKPGHLVGHAGRRSVDRIGAYERAGADWVILALRAPFDFDGLDLFIREVMPKFPAGGPA